MEVQRFNEWLAGDEWLEHVAWGGTDAPLPGFGRCRLLHDTNDPGMTFMALRRADATLRAQAAASILPFIPKVGAVMPVAEGNCSVCVSRHSCAVGSLTV